MPFLRQSHSRAVWIFASRHAYTYVRRITAPHCVLAKDRFSRHVIIARVQVFILASVCLSILACSILEASAQEPASTESTTATTADDALDTSQFPPELFPKCPTYQYTAVQEKPDKIAGLFSDHQHYRLVIGAGTFLDHPETNNRSFVAPTARRVDAQLDAAKWAALPGLLKTNNNIPYLEGTRATKAAIRAAIQEMAALLDQGDFGIIYYVGHGHYAPSHKDLTLSVYDRLVTDDDGFRLSDIVGLLENSATHTDVKEIPHYFIILETCYSGTVVPAKSWAVVNQGDIQLIARIELEESIPQVVIVSATAAGSLAQAYNLHGTNLSAFGVFFLRAFNEDWECVDTNEDGIITLNELVSYLKERLQKASEVDAIDDVMIPQASSREPTNFIAYSAKYHVTDGDRREIGNLLVTPKPNQVSTLTLPSGTTYTCTNSTPCSVPISISQQGNIQVTAQPISDPLPSGGVVRAVAAVGTAFGLRSTKACTECNSPSSFAREGSVSMDSLRAGSKVVAGVPVKLQ